MSNRTLINGTAYDIKSGSVLIEGTGYAIQKGRTLINGTGYDISIAQKLYLYDQGNEYAAITGGWNNITDFTQPGYTSTIIYQITMMCLLFSAPIVWWIYLHILR